MEVLEGKFSVEEGDDENLCDSFFTDEGRLRLGEECCRGVE